MRTRTIRSSSLTGFAQLSRTHGLDPEAIAGAHNVPIAALSEPDLRIPFRSVTGMLMDAAALSGLEDFGLRLAETRTSSVWGMLALAAQEQATLGDALRILRRHARLQSDGTWITIAKVRDQTEVQVNFFENGPPLMMRVATDLTIAMLVRGLKDWAGETWRPQGICFRYSRPQSVGQHHRLFGEGIHFEQAFDGIVFRSSDLEAPIQPSGPAASPSTTRAATNAVIELQRSFPDRLSDTVVEAVVRLLPEGTCTCEEIARGLGLGVRTLQRRLAQDDTSFMALLDRGREILAQSYVDGSKRPLVEVAELLGFNSQQAFNHWYRARYRISPSDSRRQAEARATARIQGTGVRFVSRTRDA